MRIEAAVLANYAAQRDAMVAGDADRLDGLLGQGFTLTHMTGYVQTRAEWVADGRDGGIDLVASGQMSPYASRAVAQV